MKSLRKLLLIGLMSLGCITMTFGKDAQIVIKGEVVNSTTKIKSYTINIYENGKMTNTLVMTKNTFNYPLPANSEVMLEFVAEGHYAKRIAFDTNLNPELIKVPRLDLKMNLVEKSDTDNCHEIQDLLDMPTAFITYSSEKEYYDKNLKFSAVIKKEIKEQLGVR
jgi:hypothetical protein